jgi:hypothetical protein
LFDLQRLTLACLLRSIYPKSDITEEPGRLAERFKEL